MNKYQQLHIFRPLISKKLTQRFGENLACIDNKGKIYGTKTKCPTGRSFYQSVGMKGHNGNDISATIGEEVYHSGTYPGWLYHDRDAAGGIGVDIVSNEMLFFPFPIPTELIPTAVPYEQDGYHGFLHYVKIRNWHLSQAVGAEGKQVTCGTVIGLAGNTGASSGPHLHFAPKWCLKDGRGVANNNGYTGAFDPNPFYNHNVTAKDHAVWLDRTIVPLSPTELKDIAEQLSLAKKVLLALQKLKHNI